MSRPLVVALVVVSLTVATAAQERDRAKIPDKYKWDLTQIYATDAAWRAAKDKLKADVPRIGQFKGKLGTSAATLADALDATNALRKEMARLSAYASLLADQDTRNSQHQGMAQEMTQLGALYGAEASYMQPEILQIDRGRLQSFFATEPRLGPSRFYLEELVRRAAHTLTEAEERILANAGPMSGSSSNTFNLLLAAEFPYPTVTLSDGRAVKVDQAAFAALRALPNRADRDHVMSAFFRTLGNFSGTLGSTINGQLRASQFYANARKYPSDLEARLDGPNIPVSVYSSLVEAMNQHLPSFHRYLQLRKRMLGVDQLHYYDLYAPLVSSVTLKYTPEEAQAHILKAVVPLGPDYVSTVQRAFNERWIDWFPNEGKSAGGYMNGSAVDVHPYILFNYNGQYADMSAIGHELGHAMHSYYSNKTQPYQLASYPTFIAEVASLFNEDLLADFMLTQVRDKETRLSILGSYLETLKANVFRQTQFAEFELRMHETAAKGQPITGEGVAASYLEITKKYYGHDQGICIVDDYVASEWSMVPHFYSPYYVFQYSTSFTAATALTEGIKAPGQAGADARRKYLALLSAGGSKHPVDLLREAGVDMTTSQPLQLTMRKMNRVMDEMEKLLAN